MTGARDGVGVGGLANEGKKCVFNTKTRLANKIR